MRSAVCRHRILLDPQRILKLHSAGFYKTIDNTDLRVWCICRAIYQLPTVELIKWLRGDRISQINFLMINNLLQQFKETFLPSQKRKSSVVLFDSIASANELAFMLGGEWDNCNSITLTEYDCIAVSEAAALIEAKWCRCGDSIALFSQVAVTLLIDRYKARERNFINANLRCSRLSKQCLKGVNLSYAFLNEADLTKADLSNAELSVADASNADLTGANLSNASLFRTNLTGANLSGANLGGAKLRKACLKGANLEGANLNGADLSLADLRGAELKNISLSGANFTGAMLTIEQLRLLKSFLK